jgi:putative transposase
MRKTKFTKGGHYHLFNRGVDNRNVFVSKEDYDRFEAYLYLLNDTESPRAANYFVGNRKEAIFDNARTEPLVAVGAFSLMPTNFHIIVSPLLENAVPKFMQKLTTAYTMYFNDKYQRSGSLFEGTYKSTASNSENHLKYLLALTHLSPAYLFNRQWVHDDVLELESLSGQLMDYRYSSIGEYISGKHTITSPNHFPRYFGRANKIDTYIRYWKDFSSTYSPDKKQS